jgi:hypothetical protein
MVRTARHESHSGGRFQASQEILRILERLRVVVAHRAAADHGTIAD